MCNLRKYETKIANRAQSASLACITMEAELMAALVLIPVVAEVYGDDNFRS